MTRSYSTRRKRPPEADANVKGYVFARKPGRIGYEGVLWHEVKWPEYDRWSPAEFYAVPGDKK
jgi:hypothetical protein